MTLDRDRILSEFIDAWNAGSRPDVDDYIARAPAEQQGELADQLLSFLTFAPTPSYDDDTLAAIRAEPIVAAALAAPAQRGGLLPSLLTSLRERFSMTTPQLASELVDALGLPTTSSRRPPPTSNAWSTASSSPRASRGGSSTRSPASSRSLAASSRAPATSAAGFPPRHPQRPPCSVPTRTPRGPSAPTSTCSPTRCRRPAAQGRDEVDDLFLGGR